MHYTHTHTDTYTHTHTRAHLATSATPTAHSCSPAFPARVCCRPQTLKGVGGSVVILEEAAYCDQGLISEVVVPLLSMSESVILCISTLLESSNHYSKFFRMTKPDGSLLFNQLQFSLVCGACALTDHPERCNHKMDDLPRWISAGNIEKIRTILSEDPGMFLRETMGVSAESTIAAFKQEHVDAFEARPMVRAGLYAPDIFVAVDPSGGGNSAFAICSIRVHNGNHVGVRRRHTPAPPLPVHPHSMQPVRLTRRRAGPARRRTSPPTRRRSTESRRRARTPPSATAATSPAGRAEARPVRTRRLGRVGDAAPHRGPRRRRRA